MKNNICPCCGARLEVVDSLCLYCGYNKFNIKEITKDTITLEETDTMCSGELYIGFGGDYIGSGEL